jgi:hypothetical protein
VECSNVGKLTSAALIIERMQHAVCSSHDQERGYGPLLATFEHSPDCTCCDFGHLRFYNNIFADSLYRIEDHSGSAHEKLRGDYTKWMKRNLKYKPWIEDKVSNTLVTIAKKMDLKPKQVTYIGIHNRRGKDHVALTKRLTQKKPLPKSYFYDAMEDMRESYDNVAFLYVSDVMKWGRKNLKDKENDMYFVGHGDGSDEDNDAYDFALLCSCNHTIVTRGAFSNWVAMWAGGEYYSEYGSIVPNEVNDALEEELAAQRKREGSAGSLVYGSAQTGEPEGLLFPDIKIDGKEGSGGGEDSSWFW